MALEEAGKAYEEINVNYSDGSNMQEWYSINPNRTVPTLVDEDVVLTESLDILKHIAQCAPSLWPEEYKAEIDEFAKLFYDVETTKLIYGWIGSKGGSAKDGAVNMLQKRIAVAKDLLLSDPDNAELWNRKVQENEARLESIANPSSALPTALAQCRKLVARCNSQLAKGGPYLFGEQFTIADCLMATALTRLEDRQQGKGGLWGDGKNFRIASYLAALKSRPSVAKSLPSQKSNTQSLQSVKENPLLYIGLGAAAIAIYLAIRNRTGPINE